MGAVKLNINKKIYRLLEEAPSSGALRNLEELEHDMFRENIYDSDEEELRHSISMRLLRMIVNLNDNGHRQRRLFYEAEKYLNLHVLVCTPANAYKSPIPKVSEIPESAWEETS